MPLASERRDYRFVSVCQSCYLTTCLYDSRWLSIYCPEVAGKKRKLAPEVIAKASQEVGLNRKHEFIRRLNNVTNQTGS